MAGWNSGKSRMVDQTLLYLSGTKNKTKHRAFAVGFLPLKSGPGQTVAFDLLGLIRASTKNRGGQRICFFGGRPA